MKKIAVIDDDRSMTLLYKILLKKILFHDDQISYFNRSSDFLEHYTDYQYLNIDISIPYKDGYDIIKEIQDQGGLKSFKIAVVSGHDYEMIKEKLSKITNSDIEIILKPVTLESLSNFLNK